MDIREKLVELIAQKVCGTWSESCDEWLPNDCGKCYANDCHISEIADHLIINGVTVQEWVSVKDRLPTREDANETESILAINKDEKYVGRWVWDIVARWPTEFTYWMPIPQPPKGE